MYHRYQYYLKAKPIERVNKFNLWRGVARKINLSEQAKMRLEWIIFYQTIAEKNATLTAKHFGISRSLFYFWLNRFNETNLKSLEDNKSSPKRTRRWNPNPIVLSRMIKLRKKYIHWSKLKLKVVYENIYGEKVSSWQFQRVIKKFNLYPPKSNKRSYKKNRAKKELISYRIRTASKNLYSIDTKVLWLFGIRYYILMAVGHDNKLAYARAYKTHKSKESEDFLHRLVYLLGEEPKIILSDNGSEFMKDFSSACDRLKIKRFHSRPYTPKDNPEVERLIKTYIYEYLNDGHWSDDINKLNKYITDWLIEYNTIRPHQTLKYLTPLEYAQKHSLLSKIGSSSTYY
jgi:transposase